MVNLFMRSALVLILLFALLFALGVAVLTYLDAPLWIALIFAVGVILLQYLLGPWILELIYKIEWRDPESVDPALANFILGACAVKGIPTPRFGLIHDGNPNAFTFGHYPGDARLVITTGLRDMLSSEERQAVVAHELGHIAHWDFVVMTVAAVIPLVLYVLFQVTLRGNRRRRDKGGGYIALVGLISFVAYIVSHYIVLLLSRTREYYADRFAGEVTDNPDALSTALVKVAYGLAAAPKDKKKKDDTRMVAAQAFGIFDPKVAQSLALAGAGSGSASSESMEEAMKWDLWNPWAILFELRSTHPLPAKRMRALERQTEAQGKVPSFSFRAAKPESYWDEFLVDVVVNYLPLLGLLVGILLAIVSIFVGFYMGAVGIVLLLLCGAWWLKRRFSYRHEFDEKRTVRSLVGEVKVSAVRSIPSTIEGKIIGRGIPGLFYSEDLVLQDESGFIVLDYRQPLRLLEFFFGWVKAESLIGQEGKATGWYRRSPKPYFEMRKLILKNGETVTSYVYPVAQFFVYAGMVSGVLLLALDLLL
jgi:heat shock protein HtpX